MLCSEPWCFHPEQIASLTDFQIEHLYRRPAVERQKQLDKEREERERQWRHGAGGGGHASDAPAPPLDDDGQMKHPPLGTPQFKRWYVSTMAPYVGLQLALKMYDEQTVEWKKQQEAKEKKG